MYMKKTEVQSFNLKSTIFIFSTKAAKQGYFLSKTQNVIMTTEFYNRIYAKNVFLD